MSSSDIIDLQPTKGADRVRAHTGTAVQAQLDQELLARIRYYVARAAEDGGHADLTRRLAQLDRETDVERTLAANAATLALAGTVLGALHNRRWLALPAVVTSFLLQHAVQGWCPPIGLFRRLGVRSRQEIDAERYALKVLRGDFPTDLAAGSGDAAGTARRLLEAVGR